MIKATSLDDLWNSAPLAEQTFGLSHVEGLPDAARSYLNHSIAPGTRLASAVRLQMHGEIKLKRWFPFKAEQVIRWDRGMIWCATVRMWGIPIRGFDRLINGKGEMRWKIFGLIPFVRASGPDITRSAAGRIGGESMWMPSVLCREDVKWTATDACHAQACIMVENERVVVEIVIDSASRLKSVKMKRWGNLDGTEFRYEDFGVLVEEEATFGGYTIPSRLRVGWYFGESRFESNGEFFRCKIDHAEYT
jgi:hypothetical protein